MTLAFLACSSASLDTVIAFSFIVQDCCFVTSTSLTWCVSRYTYVVQNLSQARSQNIELDLMLRHHDKCHVLTLRRYRLGVDLLETIHYVSLANRVYNRRTVPIVTSPNLLGGTIPSSYLANTIGRSAAEQRKGTSLMAVRLTERQTETFPQSPGQCCSKPLVRALVITNDCPPSKSTCSGQRALPAVS